MIVKGLIKKDKKTKDLIIRLNAGDIAVISHRDIDEVAASSLAESKIKCVLNLDETISGKYPNKGPMILLNAGIPIFETLDANVFNLLEEGKTIEINNGELIYKNEVVCECEELDEHKIKERLDIGYENIESELDRFIENTLHYAKKEKGLVLGKTAIPSVKTNMQSRHVLIVVRGQDYKKDLMAIKYYIKEVNPILIGVDGGGDALLEFGYTPDLVIGDMDSISDRCLKVSKEIIVHAYTNGEAPGLERVNNLGLEAITFPAPGTSEDLALLLAYHNKADLIVAVGTHNSMIDFLEKGRKGMASTFLVRLKVGVKLIDAKGVNELYKTSLKPKYMLGLGVSAFIPILIMVLLFPPMKELLQLMHMKIKLLLGF